MSDTTCVVCHGLVQFKEEETSLDDDGVCPTCNGMMGQENDDG